MPRLARFWDSLENDNFFDIVPLSPLKQLTSGDKEKSNSATKIQRQWLAGLSNFRDDELSTILYAKPLIQRKTPDKIHHFQNDKYYGPKRVTVGYSKSMLSSSLGNLTQPPSKPTRRVGRIRCSTNDVAAGSLPQLLENLELFATKNNQDFTSNSTLCSAGCLDSSCPNDPDPDPEKLKHIKLPGFRGDLAKALKHSTSSVNGRSSSVSRNPPPSYEQFQVLRRNSMKSQNSASMPSTSRNTVTVDRVHVQQAISRVEVGAENGMSTILRSPYSVRSDSITSVDSGQCSGDQVERPSILSFRQESKDDEEFGTMPSYARTASTMDHVLRTSSAIYTLLSATLDANLSRDLLAKSSVFIQLLETSPCVGHLPKNEMAQLKRSVQELQKNRENGIIDLNNMTNFFAILLRKSIESVLQIFVKIICKYLDEANSKDRLLSISLEHLIHICLFGDELCIEAIQRNAISSIIRLLKCPSENDSRFLLRALAVLCGVSKGALSLLTQGGLELVIDRLLSKSSAMCSVEAAGILTQLTNPNSAFIRLNHVQPIIERLLDLMDQCNTGDSLLLASAALNNVILQNSNGVDIFYRNNGIRRFINAYNRDNCATIFVQEQIVTAFSRLASRHYEKQLIEQEAIPVLLEFLSLTHLVHSDYCRRIRYKAAVCIGTLANSEIGLKALYHCKAYAILSNVLHDDNNLSNPFNMICNNIRSRLESKYQSESAV